MKNYTFGYARVSTEQQNLDRQLDALKKHGVDIIYNEKMSTGKLLFTLMSAIAQFERDVIADRTREGLRCARARGRNGGRPKASPDAVRKAVKFYNTRQYSIKEIEELTGVKKSTLYRNLSK